MNAALSISIAFLLIAIAPMPYGYYHILKFVVCFSAIKEAMKYYQIQNNWSNRVLAFTAIALLYNPIVKIPLGKTLWTIINILTIIYFVISIKTQPK